MKPIRIIAHMDMDAFFASVEERERPYLSGYPIVVGSDPQQGRGRGVVSTANYAARAFGIRSALPIGEAWRLAKQARARGEQETLFLTPRFSVYSKASQEVQERVRAALPSGTVFEVASIDEWYIDISQLGTFENARNVFTRLQEDVLRTERLSVSVGIAGNKLVAKIASDYRKPGGLTVVPPEEAESFLAPLPVVRIPGIGPRAFASLRRQGVVAVGDLKTLSTDTLVETLGSYGSTLRARARGEDHRPLETERELKSIGEQETFGQDTRSPAVVLPLAARLSDAVFARFEKAGYSGWNRTVVTIRFADFTTKTRSKTTSVSLETRLDLERISLQLLLPFLDARANPKQQAIRMIGIRLERLYLEKTLRLHGF